MRLADDKNERSDLGVHDEKRRWESGVSRFINRQKAVAAYHYH